MKAKVSELSNKLYWIQDENTPLEHIEAFNNCTTTLSELKEMWEDAKIWTRVDSVFPNTEDKFGLNINYVKRLHLFEYIKNSPRKFTIEQVIDMCYYVSENFYKNINNVPIHITSLPPNGIEVEIEGNKIVKVIL